MLCQPQSTCLFGPVLELYGFQVLMKQLLSNQLKWLELKIIPNTHRRCAVVLKPR